MNKTGELERNQLTTSLWYTDLWSKNTGAILVLGE